MHIGKSSAGWCFALRIYPEDGITDLNDWTKLLVNGQIFDEYGQSLLTIEMLDVIMNRNGCAVPSDTFDYEADHATPGPYGLVRAAIDDRHCVGHGSGTWDLCVGEFS